MTYTFEEKGGRLHVKSDFAEFFIDPIPARVGAPMLAQVLNLAFDGGVELAADDTESMYMTALGEKSYEEVRDTVRLPDWGKICNAILFWQTSGLEACVAMCEGGVGKALEVHLSTMGLSLQQILPLLEEADSTPEPDATKDTTTPPASESKSKSAGPSKKPKSSKPTSAGPKSSPSGTPSSATSTPSTESTGETTT